ncbi:MAG: hypothetical protein ACYCQI_13060 [Gammaproteobacteria bacterium]
MRIKLFLALILLLFSTVTYAEFSGTLTATGGVGEYTVMIEDDITGHVYNGKAETLKDDSLHINVNDSQEFYNGYATEDETGQYHFELTDPTSGKKLMGILEEDQEY